ncbi:apolipoprotein D-like [Pollicipes pollicipes]|uniref:apolipoprotein D-like n=1 Tax=Pollicipes pollicipes TaxID=41117 RepID=UPI0018856108|nr:apolipoprotein D-like [Pollicipes pollicipes]
MSPPLPVLPLLLLTAVSLCGANFSELGLCPQAPRQTDVAIGRLAGIWYEQMRYRDPGFRARCTRLVLTPLADGRVRINETRLDAADGSRYETADVARLDDGLLRTASSDYMVIATDYRQHSMLQLCRQYRGFHDDCPVA